MLVYLKLNCSRQSEPMNLILRRPLKPMIQHTTASLMHMIQLVAILDLVRTNSQVSVYTPFSFFLPSHPLCSISSRILLQSQRGVDKHQRPKHNECLQVFVREGKHTRIHSIVLRGNEKCNREERKRSRRS